MRMKNYRVTVFEKQTYQVKAKDASKARDKVLSGLVTKSDAEIDGTDVEEIK